MAKKTAEKKEKNLGGRPRKEFTDKEWKSIDYMAIIHCTGEEIAGVMGVDFDTLSARIKEKYGVESFSAWYKMKSASGNMSLRREQWKLAERGNSTMLIWLGKQWLGQEEKIVAEANFEDLTPLAELLKGGSK